MTKAEFLEGLADAADELLISLNAKINQLEAQVDILQQVNTSEVERRRDLEGRLKGLALALETAEAEAANIAGAGDECRCPSCLTIRGIAAYVRAF